MFVLYHTIANLSTIISNACSLWRILILPYNPILVKLLLILSMYSGVKLSSALYIVRKKVETGDNARLYYW
jgi:hypothetical protein